MTAIGTIRLGIGSRWEDTYDIFKVVQHFKNGKIAIRVNFKGKAKIFNVQPKFITWATPA